MGRLHGGLLFVVFLLQVNCSHSVYITDSTDRLHEVLSEFAFLHPIRTDSEGRFLSSLVSAHHIHRPKRHAPSEEEDTPTGPESDVESPQTPPTWEPPSSSSRNSGRSHRMDPEEGAELFYNVTAFGQELHLRLVPNTRLVAPAATIEWEESGRHHSQPIGDAGCLYTGTVSNMADTSVAISNCDGLAGMIRTSQEEFFIEPLDRWRPEGGGGGGGRRHIIYRSSAIIRKQSPGSPAQAVNQTADDFFRGTLLGSVDMVLSGSGSARRRRFIEEAELFNIEVLLAVDYSVLLFHSREHIQKYLLTLMNIVNEIYQDHSLGANINVVLVRIIVLSAAKSQELISVGDAQRSLEKVCGWSYLQHREQSHAEQHDHTIYLTRQEFGPSGMQGYAPVTGMCHLHRSCVLVIEDGFTSAFVAAHETGHVLGMEHDGEANDCADDVPLGSIMSPRVQATFSRYHWSRCSWRELHQYLHTYDCLRDDPFNHDWPAQPQLPGFQYSMDQQCRFDFGPGYSLCTAYPNPDPCKQLWCSDYSNPFYCKTKKGPPLDGTKCGPGKHCFKGFCLKLTSDMLRQDGGWGTWSSYGPCSRTCGGGVRFRTRRCDNPHPANGGRTCFGNSYEFQLCSQEDCPPLADFREDQCKVWNPFFEHEGKKHHWLPYQHPDHDERCRLYCQSKETAEVVSMNRMVHDGTSCSYDDSFSVCVRGECEHVGCDGQIASDLQEDRCGVCGGDNSSCKIIKGNFTRSTKKEGLLKILEIPKGARHLLIQESKGTAHILAMKNLDTGDIFLNSDDRLPETCDVIEKGVFWEYGNTEEYEFIKTTGPLRYDALLMVRSHGDSKVTVSYKYVLQERLRSSLESNLVQEDTIFYEWALKRWSSCSKQCGGGRQYTRFGCRRKADGKMVQRMFCSNIHKPRAISRTCNTQACQSPRWYSHDWQPCSATCGHNGWQRRWVSCQQESSRGQQRSVNSNLCNGERPIAKRTCNRTPCPPTWRAGPWTPCSVSCGNGTRERQVVCSRPGGSAGNCSEPRPITTHNCQAPPCNGDHKSAIIQWLSRSNPEFPSVRISTKRCRGDRSVFCRMEVLSRYCSIPGYRQMCCKSCSQGNFSNPVNLSSVAPPTDSSVAPPTNSSVVPPTDSSVVPPTDSSVAPPTDSSVAPPTDSSVAPPTDSSVAPPTDSSVVPPTDSSVAPPTDSSVAPPTDSSVAPPTESTVAPPIENSVAPPTESSMAPPTDSRVAPPTESSWSLDTETSASTSSWSDSTYDVIDDITSTPSSTFPTTLPTTSGTSTDFVYVEYDDYDDYLSYDESSGSPTTVTPTTTTTPTRRPRKTARPHLFRKKSPTIPPVTVSTVTLESLLRISTSFSPATTSRGKTLQGMTSGSHSGQVAASSPSFFPLVKKDNNSVDEVPYRIVGLDGETGRGQPNYFVPRVPQIRERTHNKRIQQLLNEKRQHSVLKRPRRTDRSPAR